MEAGKPRAVNPIPKRCWRPAINWRGNPWTACRSTCPWQQHRSPAERPGAIADQLRERFAELGVPLHTTTPHRQGPALIECYPHVALLTLLNRNDRVSYKVSRSAQYWKAERPPIAERVKRLLAEFSAIPLTLPQPHEVSTLSSLKPVEDMLDALICAWIGIEHLEGRTVGLGDDTAAIWVPQSLTNHSFRVRPITNRMRHQVNDKTAQPADTEWRGQAS